MAGCNLLLDITGLLFAMDLFGVCLFKKPEPYMIPTLPYIYTLVSEGLEDPDNSGP